MNNRWCIAKAVAKKIMGVKKLVMSVLILAKTNSYPQTNTESENYEYSLV